MSPTQEPKKPAWQSGFIQTNGVRLHYTRTGGDWPPIVLAHGLSGDGLCWTPIARALEADYDVVMVDARFHGRSDAPAQDFNTSVMADDLAGAITGLSLESPIIMGHSMGAATTLILAGRYPELPRAIALEDPPAWWTPGAETRFNLTWQIEARAQLAGQQRQARGAIIAAQRAAAPQWSMDELDPWADAKLRFRLSYFDRLRPLVVDWPDLLRRITCPVLLITGEPALGSAVTDQQATAVREWVPQLRLAHIASAGHNIRRDQFEAYLAAIVPQLAAWTGGALPPVSGCN